MSTPARRHRQRLEAQKAHAAAKDASIALESRSPYAVMLAKLSADMRRLKDIQSIEKKIEVKRQLLPEYDAWIDGTLAAASGKQDDVLTSVMVWHIDAGNYRRGLLLAGYALAHGLQLPSRYNRSLGCLVAEEIANAALKVLALGGLTPDLAGDWNETLSTTVELTAAADMPDEVRARLKQAQGLVTGELNKPGEAIGHLRRALELNPAAGVKKDIERLERALKNKAASEQPAA
jgi:tetratricopeptide (TPR) repeat protein